MLCNLEPVSFTTYFAFYGRPCHTEYVGIEKEHKEEQVQNSCSEGHNGDVVCVKDYTVENDEVIGREEVKEHECGNTDKEVKRVKS